MNIVKLLKNIVLLFLIFEHAYAFDNKKCSRIMVGGSGLGVFLSTSSYVSSTGDCAMMGQVDHDKKVFIAYNHDKLIDDFAKGSGEYSRSFARLHGCNKIGQERYPVFMKKHFKDVSRLNFESDFEKSFEKVESYFKTDAVLKSSCRFVKS
ncbi:MAG: DUF3015 family protein [Bacteriovoracia bacterium]